MKRYQNAELAVFCAVKWEPAGSLAVHFFSLAADTLSALAEWIALKSIQAH